MSWCCKSVSAGGRMFDPVRWPQIGCHVSLYQRSEREGGTGNNEWWPGAGGLASGGDTLITIVPDISYAFVCLTFDNDLSLILTQWGIYYQHAMHTCKIQMTSSTNSIKENTQNINHEQELISSLQDDPSVLLDSISRPFGWGTSW